MEKLQKAIRLKSKKSNIALFNIRINSQSRSSGINT